MAEKGTRYRAEIEFTIPDRATDDEVEAWVRFMLHDTSALPLSNKLGNHDFDAELMEWEQIEGDSER